ncbi:hypothetical protein [Candidatus Poriferisodalis sp.]|uniref:hypothetical protein n=1 Tax=Candidatus Poriferisodalis sp. TaxID=3101277 RepID=UPI003D120F51
MWKKIIGIAVVSLLLVTGCGFAETTPEKESRKVQEDTLTRAFDVVPAQPPDRFPARNAINTSMAETARQGEWYTYSLNFDGTPIFYVVSEFAPMSLCDSISATDQTITHRESIAVRRAPSLDGIYRGGSDCRTFQVMTTNGNYIRFNPGNTPWISTRQPLRLETDVLQLDFDAE